MRQLEVARDDEVTVSLVNLPVGRSATFRINKQAEFLQDPRLALEVHLRRYPCLSLGDALEVQVDNTVFLVTVTQLEPAEAVSIVDMDLAIDIEV